MKQLLITLAITLIAVTLQAQSLYVASDAGSGVSYVENVHLGINWDIGQDFKFRALSGYSQINGRGDYMDAGFGLEKTLSLDVFGLNPVISTDVRGFFGDNRLTQADKLIEGVERPTEGLALGLFAGVSYHALSIGVALEQYPTFNSDIYINPLSVRLSF